MSRLVDLLVVHCSATPSSRADVDVREIDRWHRKRGFLRVGYHYVIKRNGSCEAGRPHKQAGAHAKGHNSNSIGICLVGGVDEKLSPEDNFTAAQRSRLILLLAHLQDLYPHACIVGHNELTNKKACPSFDVQQWLVDWYPGGLRD